VTDEGLNGCFGDHGYYFPLQILTSILVRYGIHPPNTYCSKPFYRFSANLSFVLEEVNSNCLNMQGKNAPELNSHCIPPVESY
jgi:hypothetical protein